MSCRLRLDKGTETGLMATIHGFLRKDHGDITNAEETVQYGPSTSNKVQCSFAVNHYNYILYPQHLTRELTS